MGVANKSTRTKTRRRVRDVDQVIADLKSPKHLAQHKDTKAVEDLPGLGQWYCIECAKWFEGENSLITHRKAKTHKRRVKALKDGPYTQKEAEAAVGFYTDNGLYHRQAQNVNSLEVNMQSPDVVT